MLAAKIVAAVAMPKTPRRRSKSPLRAGLDSPGSSAKIHRPQRRHMKGPLPGSMPNLTVSPAGRYELAPKTAKEAKANATRAMVRTPASALANTSLPVGIAPVVRRL